MTEKRVFTLRENDTVLCEFPVFQGTAGANVIDIKNLYAKTGMFAYDAGFNSTASCTSKITFVDDHAGALFYRGYSIEQLVENCSNSHYENRSCCIKENRVKKMKISDGITI